MMDWDKALDYLTDCMRAYTEIGLTGSLALSVVLNPLLHRYMQGERTEKLYDEIMSIE